MRKKLFVTWTWIMLLLVPVPVFAASLDEVVTQNEAQGSGTNNGDANGSSSIIDSISEKSDMSKETEITAKISSPLIKAASIVAQIMFYIIVALLPVSVLADLGFLVIPFARTGGQQSNMTGQNSMNNGYGGMSTGYGGMGMNRYGGMGMNRYGGMGMGMNNGMGNAGQQPIMENKFLGIKVSENVIAIASSQVSTVEKIKEYAKDTTVKIVFSGVICVLLITGVLTRVALTIGDSVGNAISSAGGML